MNATTVVLPYNETAVYDSRIRLVTTVTKFDYSLTLLTVVPPTVIKTPANVVKVTPIYMPAPAGTAIAAALPRIESTAPVRVITTPAVTIAAKLAAALALSWRLRQVPPLLPHQYPPSLPSDTRRKTRCKAAPSWPSQSRYTTTQRSGSPPVPTPAPTPTR
jgi:hypothetical protein